MVDQFGGGQTLTVFQKTVLYSPELEGGMRELEETLYFRYPGQFRSEVKGPELEKVQVVTMGGGVTIIDGKVAGETEGLFDHFKDLIVFKDPELLGDQLIQLGVNLDVVSLGRFEDRVAYVIGARYPDETTPQLWVDKQDFTPLRFVLSGDGEGPDKEIQYTEYRALDKKKRYPTRILFLERDTLVKMHVLEAFEIDAYLPDELFDVAYLKTLYETMVSEPETPSASTELEEVKKSIRDFRKIFE
jgi:hypothetical protein